MYMLIFFVFLVVFRASSPVANCSKQGEITFTLASAHLQSLLTGFLWTETGRLADTAGSHFSIRIKGETSEGLSNSPSDKYC